MSSVNVRYSKDGGRNWSDWRKLDMGEVGDFCQRVQLRRLGRGYQWVFDILVTDAVPSDLIAASIMPEATDS